MFVDLNIVNIFIINIFIECHYDEIVYTNDEYVCKKKWQGTHKLDTCFIWLLSTQNKTVTNVLYLYRYMINNVIRSETKKSIYNEEIPCIWTKIIIIVIRLVLVSNLCKYLGS